MKRSYISLSCLVALVGLFLGLTPPAAYAATCTSIGSGTWNTAGTWSCGHVPLATDDVVIAIGHNVLLDIASAAVAGLTVNTTAIFTGLDLNSNTLTVNGNVVHNGTGLPVSGIYSLFNATLNINGSSCNTKATLTGVGNFVTVGGTITVNVTNVDTSGFTGTGNGTVVINGSGTVRTGTTNGIAYNITQCVAPVTSAVGGVAEIITMPTASTSGLGYLVGLAGVVMLVGAGWLMKR